MALERREQGVDVDQARRCAVRQLASLLLLDSEILDLRRMTLRRGHQALATAVEQHDGIVEVIQQRRRRIVTEVREEEVEPFLVHPRGEQSAVAVPLLAHVVSERRGVEAADRLERTGDRPRG